MPRPDRIEGFAIVSADGMIADRHAEQPPALKLEADQRFFYGSLDKADAVVNGRHSNEGGPSAAQRPRLVLSRRVADIARDPGNDKAVLWNPAGASLEDAWGALGLSGGLLAVVGGTDVFGHFLEHGYDAFHLSRAIHAHLPGGRPVFPGIPPATPDALLQQHGLKPDPEQMLDAAVGLTMVTWRR